jgi:hypothetical protein
MDERCSYARMGTLDCRTRAEGIRSVEPGGETNDEAEIPEDQVAAEVGVEVAESGD